MVFGQNQKITPKMLFPSAPNRPATYKMHHFQLVSGIHFGLLPLRAGDDVAIQLNCNPVALQLQSCDKRIQCCTSIQRRKFSGLAVQGNFKHVVVLTS